MINFKQYDQDNPLIWDLFVTYAHKAKHKGYEKYSAKRIFEDIRWRNPKKKMSLNNTMHADYASRMMDLYPNFRGFFEVRPRKTPRI